MGTVPAPTAASSPIPPARPSDERPSSKPSPSRSPPSKVDYATAPLPPGWQRVKHPDPNIDRFFYVDHTNKETSWHHPDSKAYKKSKGRQQTMGSVDDSGDRRGMVQSSSSTALPTGGGGAASLDGQRPQT